MDVIDRLRVDQIFCVYMEYGDDFCECIEKVAREKGIRAGAVLSGVATFDRARIHHIAHTEFPPADKFVELEGPIELCSVDGIIADGKPHLHCTMALRGDELFAGHLERGCKVLYLAEAVVAKFSGRDLERDRHPRYGTPRLKAR
jgi:predicted DNA-binding protein with PD1-like motif